MEIVIQEVEEILDVVVVEIEVAHPEEEAKVDLLVEPFTAVLTESTARKLYGGIDPVGTTFELMHQFEVNPVTYTVIAVIADFPENSHFKISALTSFEDPIGYKGTAWTYLKLEPGVNPVEVEENIKFFVDNNEDLDYSEGLFPRLQAVGDIHLHSHKARELQANVRFRTVLIVLITGMLVFMLVFMLELMLAYSNFCWKRSL